VALAGGAVTEAVARLHAGGATIASVCTGAVFLAAAGLLQGRPAITHRGAIDFIREHGADVREEARVVDDGDIVSAGGVTSGLDLAFHLVERFVDAETAERGAIRAEHDRRGPVVVTTAA
ncbi:MAG: DJ-1/PfpI family protein, partial [Solirubrobacteraceae bacterium]|nr:DJ-1/PfpI family protein [Solirubrobacteraceae bacterium]